MVPIAAMSKIVRVWEMPLPKTGAKYYHALLELPDIEFKSWLSVERLIKIH